MNAREEIGKLVKEAQAKVVPLPQMKPIDWFNDKYQNAMNGPAKKFDFKGEALKILKPFRQRVGQHGADSLAREFSSQLKDMQSNPGKYDEKAQRKMLDQWKSRIAQFDRDAARSESNRRLSQNRQAVVYPGSSNTTASGRIGRQTVQGGSAPVSRVQDSEVQPRLNSVKTVNGQNYFDVGGGKAVAQNELPSMKMMARWNTPFPATAAGRKSYLASYLPRAMRMPKYIHAANNLFAKSGK